MSNYSPNYNAFVGASKQRGVALIVGLLFLVVLTLLGITAMTTTTLEEKMAGNARDAEIAFQAAEAGLRDGEGDVWQKLTAANAFDASCTNGLCLPSSTSTRQWENPANLSATTGRVYGYATGAVALSTVANQPRYIVELMPELPAGGLTTDASAGDSLTKGIGKSSGGQPFRVTALGWGAASTTSATVQEIFVKK